MPWEKPIRPAILRPEERRRWTALRITSSTSVGMALREEPSRISEALMGKSTQRLKGPQPSKKGRMPGPGCEGKGAGGDVSFVCIRLSGVSIEIAISASKELLFSHTLSPFGSQRYSYCNCGRERRTHQKTYLPGSQS